MITNKTEQTEPSIWNKTRTMSFTSGKGGVGKTTVVTNLAVQLASRGKKVLILDGDLGLSNVDVMMGVRATKNIFDVLNNECRLEEIIIEARDNIFLIPGGSGIYGLSNITEMQKHLLMEQVNMLGNFDYLLIDTASGIDDNVLYLNSAAQEINVVLTPEPASMTDAYALIKVLNSKRKEEKFSIICNQVQNEKAGYDLFKRLYDVTSKFLYVSLDYKGSIPSDLALRKANLSQKIISAESNRALSKFAFSDLADKYCDFSNIEEAKGGMQFFWEHLVHVA